MNKKPFVHNPGYGRIFKNIVTPQGYSLWGGTMTTHVAIDKKNFQRVSIEATAIRAPRDAGKAELKQHAKAGGDRYEVKFTQINDDKPWQYLGHVTMPAFAGRRSQVIDTPVGKLSASILAPRDQSDWSIQFRVLRDISGAVHGNRPM